MKFNELLIKLKNIDPLCQINDRLMSGGLKSLATWTCLSVLIFKYIYFCVHIMYIALCLDGIKWPGWHLSLGVTSLCHVGWTCSHSFILILSIRSLSPGQPRFFSPCSKTSSTGIPRHLEDEAVEGGSPCPVHQCCGRQAPCCPLAAAYTCTGPGSSRQHRVDAALGSVGTASAFLLPFEHQRRMEAVGTEGDRMPTHAETRARRWLSRVPGAPEFHTTQLLDFILF